ncbi:MAG: insulinase family protein [Bacteroidota bacterium]|nr:insulinase family protein [Bacteroidota bacterium]
MINRILAPEFKKVVEIDFSQAKNITLDNNISLHIINAGTQPVIRFEIIIKAGAVEEPKPGYSYFTSKILQEGTKYKSSKEISRQLDKFGAFLEVNPGNDYVIIVLYTLSKHLSSVLPILQDILFNPSFPEDELETLKRIKIQNTKVNQEKTNYLSSIIFRKSIFGNAHPYGRELLENNINDITADVLKTFYNQYYHNSWDIIVSGLIQEDDIKIINLYFGKHQVKPTNTSSPNKPSGTPGNHLINKEDSLQSSIRTGKLLFNKSNKDVHKFKIVNEILGGYFGSRLMKNIREEKGFTYGIQSNLVSLKQEGYFVIGTDVKKEFTSKTLEEIYKEIKVLQQEPVDLQELETVKNYMTGSFLSEINTPFALADKFKSIYLHDLNYDYYKNFIATINTITPQEILETAQQYLHVDSMTEVIVGGL